MIMSFVDHHSESNFGAPVPDIEPARMGAAFLRPDPLHWLWYAVGGRLPERYRSWVLHDTTSSTWVLRHVLRILVALVLPVTALLLWVPAGPGLRFLTAFVTGACALMFTVLYTNEIAEWRLVQAGYPWGYGAEVRAHRSEDAQRLANRRRRERNEARYNRRRR
jgi:hypothetical protein